MDQKRDDARKHLIAFFEKDESLAGKVAFVGMIRPVPLGIVVKTHTDLDREFNYSVDDVAGMARSPYFPDPKALVDEVLAEFARHRDRLEADHCALIAELALGRNDKQTAGKAGLAGAREQNGMDIVNCASCRFWEKAGQGKAGWRMGMGRCTNVPKYYDAGEDSGSENPDEWGDDSYVLKPEFKGVKALALDGSGYLAELLITADFACISFATRD